MLDLCVKYVPILTSLQHLWYQVHVYELTFLSLGGAGFGIPARQEGSQAKDHFFRWHFNKCELKTTDVGTFIVTKLDVFSMASWDRTGSFKPGRGLFLIPILPPCQFNTIPQI